LLFIEESFLVVADKPHSPSTNNVNAPALDSSKFGLPSVVANLRLRVQVVRPPINFAHLLSRKQAGVKPIYLSRRKFMPASCYSMKMGYNTIVHEVMLA